MSRSSPNVDSRQLLQPGAVEPVCGAEVGGVGPNQLDDSGAGNFGREQLERLRFKEGVHRQTGLRRVRLDGELAYPGLRRELRHDGGERDAQPGAVRLVLRIAGDEALGSL